MIGIFDSGVGGLSVWKELYGLMPYRNFIYVADSAYCPYGRKSVDEITARARKISEFLISKNTDIIVVACNTATAAAIKYLRSHFPIPFVGMEPAIKPAALESKTGVIGVLATAGTFKGSLYINTFTKFATNIKVVEQAGDGLVELVESGQTAGYEAEMLLHKYIDPIAAAGADRLVLGCTHYPFLTDTIKKITGNRIVIINPAPAVALQTKKILSEQGKNIENGSGNSLFISTGNIDILKKLVHKVSINTDNQSFTVLNF